MLLFHYPTTQPTGFAYLKRTVKLELGSLTDQQPTDGMPSAHGSPTCWRKRSTTGGATSLRSMCTERSGRKPRFFTASIIARPTSRRPIVSLVTMQTRSPRQRQRTSTAVAQGDLRDRVVPWKSRFFGSAWARYDLARPDTFRLVPPKEREAALRRDYPAMRDMYLSEPRTFDDILRALSDLERRINSETS